jgi:hypothetical protein
MKCAASYEDQQLSLIFKKHLLKIKAHTSGNGKSGVEKL